MRKVLIINDSGFERIVLRDQVQNLGFEVKATDEFEGLRLIKRYQPDIVIANLTMTDITGEQLIEQIKSIQPDIRCLLSTCSRNRHLASQAIDGVLETPATMEQLSKLLHDQLDSGSIQVKEIEPVVKINNSVRGASPGEKELYNKSDAGEHNIIKNDFAFCPYCGKELEKSESKYIFCPFCGSRL